MAGGCLFFRAFKEATPDFLYHAFTDQNFKSVLNRKCRLMDFLFSNPPTSDSFEAIHRVWMCLQVVLYESGHIKTVVVLAVVAHVGTIT